MKADPDPTLKQGQLDMVTAKFQVYSTRLRNFSDADSDPDPTVKQGQLDMVSAKFQVYGTGTLLVS